MGYHSLLVYCGGNRKMHTPPAIQLAVTGLPQQVEGVISTETHIASRHSRPISMVVRGHTLTPGRHVHLQSLNAKLPHLLMPAHLPIALQL